MCSGDSSKNSQGKPSAEDFDETPKLRMGAATRGVVEVPSVDREREAHNDESPTLAMDSLLASGEEKEHDRLSQLDSSSAEDAD